MTEQLVEWSDALSIGLDEVDDQHKTLVGMLNELHVAIRERHGTERSRAVLDRLTEYTRVHFATEEGLMRLLKYPGLEIHKARHAALMQEVGALQAKLDSGQGAISFELLHFLKSWLTKHIVESDKRFGDFALASGTPIVAAPAAAPKPAKPAKPWWRFW